MPVCVVEQRINLRRTSGGQDLVVSITSEDLRQMAENFPKWKGPIPIFREPHRDLSDGSAADGFLEAVQVRGNALWGEIFLTADLFAEVEGEHWRGFSPDVAWNAKRASFELDGAAVAGGVYTNRPATDLHYRIDLAAAAAAGFSDIGTFVMQFSMAADSPPPQEERPMDAPDLTVQLATATASLTQKETLITQLTNERDTIKNELATVKARAVQAEVDLSVALKDTETAKAHETRREVAAQYAEKTISNLELQLSAERKKNVVLHKEQFGAKVLKLCREGNRRGAAGSFFGRDGLRTVEADPCAWHLARFGQEENTVALEDYVNALPKNASMSLPAGLPADDDSETVLDADRKANVAQLGLNPKFVGIRNESDLRALQLKEAAKAK